MLKRLLLFLGLFLPATAYAQFGPLLGSLIGQATSSGSKEPPYALIEWREWDGNARLKLYTDSLRAVSVAINRYPDSAQFYLRRGLLRVEAGLATEGKQDLLMARGKGVAYPHYDFMLGKAFFMLAAKKAALDSFEKQIALTPTDPQPYYYRAVRSCTRLYTQPG